MRRYELSLGSFRAVHDGMPDTGASLSGGWEIPPRRAAMQGRLVYPTPVPAAPVQKESARLPATLRRMSAPPPEEDALPFRQTSRTRPRRGRASTSSTATQHRLPAARRPAQPPPPTPPGGAPTEHRRESDPVGPFVSFPAQLLPAHDTESPHLALAAPRHRLRQHPDTGSLRRRPQRIPPY